MIQTADGVKASSHTATLALAIEDAPVNLTHVELRHEALLSVLDAEDTDVSNVVPVQDSCGNVTENQESECNQLGLEESEGLEGQESQHDGQDISSFEGLVSQLRVNDACSGH